VRLPPSEVSSDRVTSRPPLPGRVCRPPAQLEWWRKYRKPESVCERWARSLSRKGKTRTLVAPLLGGRDATATLSRAVTSCVVVVVVRG
jgi:hypothetical protein